MPPAKKRQPPPEVDEEQQPDDDEVIPNRIAARVRIARMCPTPDCGWRHFDDPEAKCPEHGKGIFQPNHPYFGKPTPTHKDTP